MLGTVDENFNKITTNLTATQQQEQRLLEVNKELQSIFANLLPDKNPFKEFVIAAKEALAKATGWGLAATGLDSCLVRRTDNGPVFVFTAEFQNKLTEAQIGTAFLSLSHEGTNAVAMVVLERNHD